MADIIKMDYLDFVSENIEQTQAMIWKNVIELIYKSQFWLEKADFELTESIDLEKFNITDFSFYKNAIERNFNNQISPLNGENIFWWVKTTGTTEGNSKYFPYTPAMLKNRDLLRMIESSLFNKKLVSKKDAKTLFFSSFWPSHNPDSQLPIGLLTSLACWRRYQVGKEQQVMPYEIYRNHEAFDQYSHFYALAADLSSMVATTAAPVLNFMKRLRADRSHLYKVLVEGHCLSAELPKIQISEPRKKYLQKILSQEVENLGIKDYWPKFENIWFWTSGSSQILAQQLSSYLKEEIPFYQISYSCSEGVISYGKMGDLPGSPLAVANTIIEFIPEGLEIKKENLLSFRDIKIGSEYEIFITNVLGLVRYRVFDVVKCVGMYKNIPLVEFQRKSQNYIALGPIQFSETDFLEIYAKIQQKYGVADFIVSPNPRSTGLTMICSSLNQRIENIKNDFESLLIETHSTYSSLLERGILVKMNLENIPDEHAFWQKLRLSKSTQSKKRLLVSTYPFL